MGENIYSKILSKTENIMMDWKYHRGIAPESVSNKLDKAMLDWILELTRCLKIWIEKGDKLTDGEIILARTNLGSLVESWLKFFYSVYYEDYCNSPKRNKEGKMIEPEKMKFEGLKQFSIGILWEKNSEMHHWISNVQDRRNAIHFFNYKNIGSSEDFISDLYIYFEFIDSIVVRLPPIEDIIDMYDGFY